MTSIYKAKAHPANGRDVRGMEGVLMSGMQRLRRMTPRVLIYARRVGAPLKDIQGLGLSQNGLGYIKAWRISKLLQISV